MAGFVASPGAYMRQGWDDQETSREQAKLRGLKIAKQNTQNQRAALGLEGDRKQAAEWDKGAENRDLTREVNNQTLTAAHDAIVANHFLEAALGSDSFTRPDFTGETTVPAVPDEGRAELLSKFFTKTKGVNDTAQVVPIGQNRFRLEGGNGERHIVTWDQALELANRMANNETAKQVRAENYKRANSRGSYVDPITNAVHETTGAEAERKGWVSLDAQKGALGLQKSQADIGSAKAQAAARRAQEGAYKERALQYRDQRLNPGGQGKGGDSRQEGAPRTAPALDRNALGTINGLIDSYAPSGLDENGVPLTDQMGRPVGGDDTLNTLLKETVPSMIQTLGMAEQAGNWNGLVAEVSGLYDQNKQSIVADAQQRGIALEPGEAETIAATLTKRSIAQTVTNPYGYAELPESGFSATEEYTPEYMQPRGDGLKIQGALSEGIDWNAPAPPAPQPRAAGLQQQPDKQPRQRARSTSGPADPAGPSVRGTITRPSNLRVDESGVVWGTGPDGQPRRSLMPPKQYGLMGKSQLTTSLRDGGQQYTVLANGALEYLTELARNGLDIPERFKDELRAVNGPKDVQALRQVFGQSF